MVVFKFCQKTAYYMPNFYHREFIGNKIILALFFGFIVSAPLF